MTSKIRTLKNKVETTKWGYFSAYTFLFVCVCAVIFLPFVKADKGFVWQGIGAAKDGYSQHYTALTYMGQWLREIVRNILFEHKFEIPLWDFSIGYGSDIITSMHYYAIGDPLNLLSIFVPSRYTEYLYDFIVVLRMYLAGLSFSLFARKMGKGKTAVLAGAFSYVLCCYSVYTAVRHPFFENPMIYAPIVLLGVEKIFRKESPFVFIFGVFLSTISNFYFLYTIVFLVVVYALIRYFTAVKLKTASDFFAKMGKLAGFGLLGIGLASIIFIPVVNVLLFSSRLSSTGGIHQVFYSLYYLRKLFVSAFSGDTAPVWTCTGFVAPAFVAIALMFQSKKRHTGSKIALVFLYFLLLFPIFGKILNGFSYVSNKWTFMIAGVVSYIIVSMWDEMIETTPKKLAVVSVAVMVYFLMAYLLGKYASENTYISIILMFFTIVFLLIRNTDALGSISKKATSVVLAMLVIVSGCINAYCRYTPGHSNYVEQFWPFGEALSGIESSSDKVASKLVDEDVFYRSEQGKTSHLNASVITGAYGTQYYWSLENGNISRFLQENGIYSYLSQKYDGINSRTFLEALASVKYFIKNNYRPVPYGFEKYKTIAMKKGKVVKATKAKIKNNDDIEEYKIYENKNALPLGYTYTSYIDRAEYEKMTLAQKQQAMLQGVVVDTHKDGVDLGRYKNISPNYTHQEIKPEIKLGKGIVKQKDGSYLVNKKSKITLTFEGVDNCENYLNIEGFKAQAKKNYELYMDDCQEFYPYEEFSKLSKAKQNKLKKEGNTTKEGDMKDKYYLAIEAECGKTSLAHNGEKYRYTNGQEDYLANIGYSEKAINKITIGIDIKGVYNFDNITVIAQPMEQFEENVKALKEETMVNEEIDGNTVKGEITLNSDKILCLSIPYSEGWSATVDGKKAEILNANTMYMALTLSKGTHKIQLTYKTPLMTLGAVVSITSLVIFLSMIAVYIVRKKKKEN